MAKQQETSLLSIPKELRLQIYDIVVSEDVQCEVLEGWEGRCGEQGFWSRPKKNAHARLHVGWVNLLLVCSTIFTELQSHGDRLQDRSYVADIEARQNRLGSLTWRRITCPPTSIKTLTINLRVNRRLNNRIRCCCRPKTIVRELYQALNVFLHSGPRLDTQRGLLAKMHVGSLVINVCPSASGHKSRNETKKENNALEALAEDVYFLVKGICEQGMVYGTVERFEIRSKKYIRQIQVPDRGKWTVPSDWRHYGFEWGLEHYRINSFESAENAYTPALYWSHGDYR